MSLLDKTLNPIISSHTVKPWWEICIYCSQPFSTDTFEKTCQRCKFFDKYKDEFSAKVMLRFILFCIVISIANAFLAYFLSKYTRNIHNYLLFSMFLDLIIGTIFWRIVKK
jgi:hypothetical protein